MGGPDDPKSTDREQAAAHSSPLRPWQRKAHASLDKGNGIELRHRPASLRQKQQQLGAMLGLVKVIDGEIVVFARIQTVPSPSGAREVRSARVIPLQQ